MKKPAPMHWFGGKAQLTKKLLPLIPYKQLYCEPFFGAGSIFWNRKPSPIEVVNDLNGDLINLMRAIQDPARFKRLRRRLAATLYSLDEFRKALDTLANETDEDERAWAFYTTQNHGFSGDAKTEGQWSRSVTCSRRGMAAAVSRWWTRFDAFPEWHKRIARAQIDNRDALEVIRYWDGPDAVFYLDPPYVSDTRITTKAYTHEMNYTQHEDLVRVILSCEGAVILSGYDTPLYTPLEDAGWAHDEFQTTCHAAGRVRGSSVIGKGNAPPRTEVVWRNPTACKETTNKGFFS